MMSQVRNVTAKLKGTRVPDEIHNTEDVIDSRNVIERIEYLEEERDSFILGHPDGTETPYPEGWAEENPDEAEELAALQALAEDGNNATSEWADGAGLVRDSYFEEYAQEFAEDIGAINQDARWPNTCIDWKQAAEELQADYTSVEFDGVTYWVR